MGNNGSCTRLVQRIIASAPDVDGNMNRWNSRVDCDDWSYEQAPKISFKRDTAHPQNDIPKIANGIRKGYDIFWIFTIRRPARYETRGIKQDIGRFWGPVQPEERYIIWDSSLMMLDPDNYLKEMGRVLDLDLSNAECIVNADLKWMRGENGLED